MKFQQIQNAQGYDSTVQLHYYQIQGTTNFSTLKKLLLFNNFKVANNFGGISLTVNTLYYKLNTIFYGQNELQMLNHICKIQEVFSYCLLIWVSGLPFSCGIGNLCNIIFGSSHLDNLFIHINTNYFFRMLMNRISFRDLLFSNVCKSLPLNTILLKKKKDSDLLDTFL